MNQQTCISLTNALFLAAYHQILCETSIKFCGIGGGERNRTDDLLLAKQALSQLSYTPVSNALDVKSLADIGSEMVGLGRLELPTSRLSGVRSNQAELQAHTKTGGVSPQTCKERRNAAP